MRRISNFQWFLILAASALLVFLVGGVSLYIRIKLPDLLPRDVNDGAGTWAFWAFWVIHSPLIFIFSRRLSFERRRLAKTLLTYIFTGIVWAMLVQGLPLLLVPFLNDSAGYTSELFRRQFIHWFGSNFLPSLLIYWLILSISLISSYYERYQKEMVKASRLDSQLSNARLQTLKMQLHPHFLFNTLNSISALVLKNENRDAVKMINRLSELLRLALDNIETQVVSLEDELEFTRRYLEIEGIRFHDRLVIEWEIDPSARTAQVPNLILQPLVENAVRHGLDSHSGKSRIKIGARWESGQLLLEVSDDGKDLEKVMRQNRAGGLGLKNTRARLAELYGEDHSFSLSRSEDQWTTARIVIPSFPSPKQLEGEQF